MKILIESDSLIQFIIATHLRTTVFNDDEVDLLMYDSMPAAKKIFSNIKTSGLYEHCYIVSSVLSVGVTKLSLFDKIIKLYRWIEMQISPMHGTKRDLVLDNYDYDAFIFCANGIFLEGLYNVCRKVNPSIKCFRYEGSLSSYLHDNENKKGYVRNRIEKLLKLIPNSLDLSDCVEKYYFFEPSLIQFPHNYVIEKLTKITSMSNAIVQSLNRVFEYNPNDINIGESVIAFEDGNLFFMNNNEEIKIYNQTAEILGSNNFVVKLHPRNNINRYSQNVKINKSIAPWELILLNNNISGKTLITSASGSIFTSLLYFGMDVNIILLYKLIGERIPLINENFKKLIYSITDMRTNKHNSNQMPIIQTPETYQEYISMIQELRDKKNLC